MNTNTGFGGTSDAIQEVLEQVKIWESTPEKRDSLITASLQKDSGVRLKKYLDKTIYNPMEERAKKIIMIGAIVSASLLLLAFMFHMMSKSKRGR